MRKLLKRQLFKFLVVGVLNTGFSYAIYACFLWLGLPFALANLGAVLLGILFSFRTQGKLVFGNSDGRLVYRFAACWAIIYGVNIGLISMLMRAGLNAYWAGAIALLPITCISYFVQRFLVFGSVPPASSAGPTR